MRRAPCIEVTPGLVWVYLYFVIHFVYSAFPGDGKADSRNGPRLPQAEAIKWSHQCSFHRMKQNILSCRLWWEIKPNGNLMLSVFKLFGRQKSTSVTVSWYEFVWKFLILCLFDWLLIHKYCSGNQLSMFFSFFFPPVLHPAQNQLVQSMPDGVRVTFSRPSRPPNIPSPPPLIPTTKPTDKPSFIQGGSISQVKHQGDDSTRTKTVFDP